MCLWLFKAYNCYCAFQSSSSFGGAVEFHILRKASCNLKSWVCSRVGAREDGSDKEASQFNFYSCQSPQHRYRWHDPYQAPLCDIQGCPGKLTYCSNVWLKESKGLEMQPSGRAPASTHRFCVLFLATGPQKRPGEK